jgi:hypothetical protein
MLDTKNLKLQGKMPAHMTSNKHSSLRFTKFTSAHSC